MYIIVSVGRHSSIDVLERGAVRILSTASMVMGRTQATSIGHGVQVLNLPLASHTVYHIPRAFELAAGCANVLKIADGWRRPVPTHI